MINSLDALPWDSLECFHDRLQVLHEMRTAQPCHRGITLTLTPPWQCLLWLVDWHIFVLSGTLAPLLSAR